MQGSQSQGHQAMSQSSQSENTVTIWPERRRPLEKKRFARRKTTLRPATFIREWEHISPIPVIANSSGKEPKDIGKASTSAKAHRGIEHSKSQKSRISVAVPAGSEPLFGEDGENELATGEETQEEEGEEEEEEEEEGGQSDDPRDIEDNIEPIFDEEREIGQGYPEEEQSPEANQPTVKPTPRVRPTTRSSPRLSHSQRLQASMTEVPLQGVDDELGSQSLRHSSQVRGSPSQRRSVRGKHSVTGVEDQQNASRQRTPVANQNNSTKKPAATEPSKPKLKNRNIFDYMTRNVTVNLPEKTPDPEVVHQKKQSRLSVPESTRSLTTPGSGPVQQDIASATRRSRDNTAREKSVTNLKKRTRGGSDSGSAERLSAVKRRKTPTEDDTGSGYATPVGSLGAGIGLPFMASTPRPKTPSLSRLGRSLQALSPISGPAIRVQRQKPQLMGPPPVPPPELVPREDDTTQRRGDFSLQVLKSKSRSRKVADLTDLDVLFNCIQETADVYRQQLASPRCAQAIADLVEKTAWDIQDVLPAADQIKKLKTSENRALASVRNHRKELLAVQREYHQLQADVDQVKKKARGKQQGPKFDREIARFIKEIRQLETVGTPKKSKDKQAFKIFSLKLSAESMDQVSVPCRRQVEQVNREARKWIKENNPHT